MGTAVAIDVQNTLDIFLPTILKTDPMKLSPDAYGYFHQDWNGNIDCFLQKECDLLTYIADGLLLFPLGLEIESTVSGQFRRVHVDDTSYVIQRRWMVEPRQSNKDWMQIDQDYALAIFMPMSDGLRIVDLEWVDVSWYFCVSFEMEKEGTSVVYERHERKETREAIVAVIEKEGEGKH